MVTMSVFKRLWSGPDKSENGKNKSSQVDEIKDHQPHNPFTELLILEHHDDNVRLLLDIDHKRCVSAADDNLAIIWDVQLGYRLVTLSGHSRPITCMIILPGISLNLVTGSSDKQIRIWDIDTGDCLKVVTQHNASVKCLLHFGSNGLFCSGGENLCLWSREGTLLAQTNTHGEDNSINFMICLSNKQLVTAIDKCLGVYTTELVSTGGTAGVTMAFTKKLPPHREAVRCLISISDDRFASGSIDGTISVWSVKTFLQMFYFNSVAVYEGVHREFPYSVEHMVCLNSRYVVAAIGAGFAIYDAMTGKTVMKKDIAHHSKINYLTFVCKCLYLATAAVDGSIRLWSFPDILEEYIHGNAGSFRTEGSNFFSLSEIWCNPNKSCPSLVGECLGHSGSVQMLLSCDQESVMSCGMDHLVIVWKNENIQCMKRSYILQTLSVKDGIV